MQGINVVQTKIDTADQSQSDSRMETFMVVAVTHETVRLVDGDLSS